MSVGVIGAGPAGLMAAKVLAEGGVAVTVFDRMPSIGRKFLMAGRGGLNLTHTEPLPGFLDRYEHQPPLIRDAVERFPPDQLRRWCEELGQLTFVGSSGRVFPTVRKASPLLRAWLKRLAALDVLFALRHRWAGWQDGALRFDTPDGAVLRRFDATVLALGGASWPQLGSDGRWVELIEATGSAVAPLRPANCGFLADWTPIFRDRFEGRPLKNVSLRFADRTARGDVVVTRTGLEAGPIYALAAPVRDAIFSHGTATVAVDLRPDLAIGQVQQQLSGRKRHESLSTSLRKVLRLSPVAVGLMHEAALRTGEPLAKRTSEAVGSLVKAVPVQLVGVAPIARAISTAGGVRLDAVDGHFMLTARPGVFVAGEMVDWEAPTGGYLLQACFATGAAAGQGTLHWLGPAADLSARSVSPNRTSAADVRTRNEVNMRDYTLAIGDQAAYGFSAADDRAAVLHAVDYLDAQGAPLSGGFVLAGPDGVLTQPSEDVGAFRQRASAFHRTENTDDVRPADPTPPDCNVG